MTFALVDFDPNAAASGRLNVGSSDMKSHLGMVNDSPWSLTLQFADGATDILPAYHSRLFLLKLQTQQILWTQRVKMAAVNAPLSVVQSTLFGERDDYSKFPIGPTNRLFNQGNQLNLNDQAVFLYHTDTANNRVLKADLGLDPLYDPTKLVYVTGYDISVGDFSIATELQFNVYNISAFIAHHYIYVPVHAISQLIPVRFPHAIPSLQVGPTNTIYVNQNQTPNGHHSVVIYGYQTLT